MKSKVFFTREITPEKVVELYRLLGKELPGKVAIKLHSGEVGNQNFLKPAFWKPIIDMVGGNVVECNTAYEGQRNTTAKHMSTLEAHGWKKYFRVDLMDAEGPDLELSIPEGKVIQKNFVGKNMKNYDSILVLSHFKGHPMGGYGGALKQLAIGCASSYGKHTSTAPETRKRSGPLTMIPSWNHGGCGQIRSGFLPWKRGVCKRDDEYVCGL